MEQTLQCAAGHEWTRPKRNGRPPAYCPDHLKWATMAPTARVRPSDRVLREWDAAVDLLEDYDYVERWTLRWMHVVRSLAARGGTWAAVDTDLVDRYIRSLRMAELHEQMATREPYVVSGGGAVKPHPGWLLREREEEKAHQLGVKLGLVEAEVETVSPRSGTPDKGYSTALERSAEEHEQVREFVGADGEPL